CSHFLGPCDIDQVRRGYKKSAEPTDYDAGGMVASSPADGVMESATCPAAPPPRRPCPPPPVHTARFRVRLPASDRWGPRAASRSRGVPGVSLMTIPFSPYDFFGFLVAGFLVLLSFERAVGRHWIIDQDLKVTTAAFWIGAAYIIGHIDANI